LIIACLDRGSRTLAAVRESGGFAVSVLAAEQKELALGFATKAAHAEKWREVAHTVHDGVPVLDGAVLWAACRLRALYDGGDHEIAVGEVFELGGDGGEPLLFHRGRYRPLEAPG
jgi:3-hydroxy-9,10-secoandrosta-1,3,5(10)-triene-9,17-dione monooxygenase reductase component